MACTLYGRSRDSSVLLGIMCHAACAFSLLIFTDRFPLWCFSLPSISRGLLVLQARGPPAARTSTLEDHRTRAPRCFCAGGGRGDRASPPRVQGDDINSQPPRGGEELTEHDPDSLSSRVGEGDTPYSIGDTPMCRTHGRSPKTTGIVSSTRDRSPDPPAGPNTAPAVNVLTITKACYVRPCTHRPAWALGRYILIDNGR